MAEMKQELWLATDLSGFCYCHDVDPPFSETEFISPNGGRILARIDAIPHVPPGHKARLTIGEAVDCRPKPVPENVPELWIQRDGEGRTFIGDSRIDCCFCVPSHFGGAVPKEHVCRIAWDESGIRLLGTPEPI